MDKVNISQLKSRLSSILDLVRAGRVFVVYDRNVPVAQLSGLPAASDPKTETAVTAGRLQGLERSGIVVRGKSLGRPKRLQDPPTPRKGTDVLGMLNDDREDAQ